MNSMNEPQSDYAEFNRRDFLRGGSLATLMTMLGGVQLVAQPAPEKEGEKKEKVKVKVAIIGLNNRGRDILDELGALKRDEKLTVDPEVAAICDNYPIMMTRAAKKVPEATKVADYKALLENKDIQAVIIATPTHEHKDIALAALKAGKHVYCEAPLANTLEDARAIALAAKEAVGQVFQPGLQMRSDPERLFLLPFIRSGALGKLVMARAQWHKKQSWRSTSPSEDREKALNWRLAKDTSLGLAGEIGIHQLDQAAWFLNKMPTAVSGNGATILWDDGREVPDTVHLSFEFPGRVRFSFDATLANSFDGEHEIYYGSDAAVMIRQSKDLENDKGTKAWMFKEVDSPLLGWEVYARKDAFYAETGIALVVGGSKQTAMNDKGAAQSPFPFAPLYYALGNFLGNCVEVNQAVQDIKETYPNIDKAALAQQLAEIKLRDAATYKEGYAATVLAIKANEAVTQRQRIELKKEMFELP